jgi:Ca2+:H+ antiporter
VIAILLPTAMKYTSVGIGEQILANLSLAVAIVLIIVYALTLLFSMKTHAYLYEVIYTTSGQSSPSALSALTTKLQII